MIKKILETNYKNISASKDIGRCLTKHISNQSALVCIGTDKAIVDSLGPLIGTMLSKKNLYIDIYGTLSKPIHALNLKECIEKLDGKNYSNIISLDASLSREKEIGHIEVREGPISPGKGLGKFLPEIGNISIIGIVESSEKEFRNLIEETRLSLIYEMAEVISEGINNAIKEEI